MSDRDLWPALPLNEWRDTYRTLHMWTQIVGKIRMGLHPPMNHWWHVTLYVSPVGLTTGPIPCPRGLFEIEFDFGKHALNISTIDGATVSRPLQAESVASFHAATLESLGKLGIAVKINPRPQEVPDAAPFDQDFANGSYDGEYANRFWRILVSTSKVLQQFRSKYIGKCSPVHFFWGSCDLACSRFSGRLAPPRKGVISGPAYSHEVSSGGFWPGGGPVDGPVYYAYTVPAPAGLEKETVRPAGAKWSPELSEFLLMHDDVRRADSPPEALYTFFESTYVAGATRGQWDRAALEV